MTLRENAKKIGISASYLSDILNNKKGTDKETILKIQRYYPNILIEEKHTIRFRVISKGSGNNE